MNTLQGELGCEFLSAGESSGFIGRAFTVITDTVLDSIIMVRANGVNAIVGPTLPAGLTIFGEISTLTVLTGVVQFYSQGERPRTLTDVAP